MVQTLIKLAFFLCVALQASAQTLRLSKSTVLGTGCKAGSATVSVKNGVVSVAADNFQANAGPGVPISSNRKNCQAALTVDIPAGYQFAFGETKLPAQVKADQGVQVTVGSEYYFQGTLSGDQDTATVPGGTSGTVTLVNEYAPKAWSACGGSQVVNINTALRANNFNNKGASGFIKTRGSVDTSIVWKKC
ncbi:hypothetical protein H1R20_g8951, partial [Candolleomyces eurysporus]